MYLNTNIRQRSSGFFETLLRCPILVQFIGSVPRKQLLRSAFLLLLLGWCQKKVSTIDTVFPCHPPPNPTPRCQSSCETLANDKGLSKSRAGPFSRPQTAWSRGAALCSSDKTNGYRSCGLVFRVPNCTEYNGAPSSLDSRLSGQIAGRTALNPCWYVVLNTNRLLIWMSLSMAEAVILATHLLLQHALPTEVLSCGSPAHAAH